MSKKQRPNRGAGTDKCPKVWEKARRAKMKGLFEELSRLLPQFDPTNQPSRIDVIQRAMSHIRDLQAQNEDLLKGGFNEVYKNKIETWKRRVKDLVCRVEQLTGILRTANIHIPPLALQTTLTWTEKRPKLWTKKITLPQEKINSIIETMGQTKKRKKDNTDSLSIKKARKKKKKTTASVEEKSKENQPVVSKAVKVVKKAIVHPLPKVSEPASFGHVASNSHPTNFDTRNASPSKRAPMVQPVLTSISTPMIHTLPPSNRTILNTSISNTFQAVNYTYANNAPSSIVPISIQSIISPQQSSMTGQTNTYILTNHGNLLPVLTPSAGVLAPVLINRPPQMVLVQQPAPSATPMLLSKPPANKRRIPRDSTVMTFSNNVPIPALTKHSHSKRSAKSGTGKNEKLIVNHETTTIASAPAMSPTAAFLSSFPVVTNNKPSNLESNEDDLQKHIDEDNIVSKPVEPGKTSTLHSKNGSNEDSTLTNNPETKAHKVDKASQATEDVAKSGNKMSLIPGNDENIDNASCHLLMKVTSASANIQSVTETTTVSDCGSNSTQVDFVSSENKSNVLPNNTAAPESANSKPKTPVQVSKSIATEINLPVAVTLAQTNPSSTKTMPTSPQISLASETTESELSRKFIPTNVAATTSDSVIEICRDATLNKVAPPDKPNTIILSEKDNRMVPVVSVSKSINASNKVNNDDKQICKLPTTSTEEKTALIPPTVSCANMIRIEHNVVHDKSLHNVLTPASKHDSTVELAQSTNTVKTVNSTVMLTNLDTLKTIYHNDSATSMAVTNQIRSCASSEATPLPLVASQVFIPNTSFTPTTFTASWSSMSTMAPSTTVSATMTSWYPNVAPKEIVQHTNKPVAPVSASWPSISGTQAGEHSLSNLVPNNSTSAASGSWRPISTDPLWMTGQSSVSESWSFNVVPKEMATNLSAPNFLEPLQKSPPKVIHSKQNPAISTSHNVTQVTAAISSNQSVRNEIGLYQFANIDNAYSRSLPLPLCETTWNSHFPRPPDCSNAPSYSKSQMTKTPVSSSYCSYNVRSHTSTISTSSAPRTSASTYCAPQLCSNNFTHPISENTPSLPNYSMADFKSVPATNTKPAESLPSKSSNIMSVRSTLPSNSLKPVFTDSKIPHTVGLPSTENAYHTLQKSSETFPNSNMRYNSGDNVKPYHSIGEYPSSKSRDNIFAGAKANSCEVTYTPHTFSSSVPKTLSTMSSSPYALNLNDATYMPNYPTPTIQPELYASSVHPLKIQPPKTVPPSLNFPPTLNNPVDNGATKAITNDTVKTSSSQCSNVAFEGTSASKRPYASTFSGHKSESDQTYVSSQSTTAPKPAAKQISVPDTKIAVNVWNGPYFPNNIQTGDTGTSWSQIDYTCLGEMKDNKPKPPINWMTQPEGRVDVGLCTQDDPFQARYQNPFDRKDSQSAQNIFDFCLNPEDDISKGKSRKKDAESNNSDYFSWFAMKVDPFVVPSTLPTLVGDLALGGDPLPAKRSKTMNLSVPEGCPFPRSAKEGDTNNSVPQEPFTNLAKNIFDFSQSDSSKTTNSTETIVLKNIFELPTPTTTKQRNTQGQNTFLSVSQLVESPTMQIQSKSDYSYYNQRPGKSKRTSGWKCSEKKCQQGGKACSSYSTEALLKTGLPPENVPIEPDFANSAPYPMDFPTDQLMMESSEANVSQAKPKSYNNRTRKQECWNTQNTPTITFSPAAPAQTFPMPIKQAVPLKSSEAVPLPVPYLSDPHLAGPQPPNLHLSPCLSAPLSFPRFPGNPLPLGFPQPKASNEPVPFTGIFPPPRPCVQPDGGFTVSGSRYPGPRKPFTYQRPGKVSFPPCSPALPADPSRKVSSKAVLPIQQMTNPVFTAPLSMGRAYPSFPAIPTQPAGPSGSSLANFNLTTIFPEMNKKGNYQYP